MYHIFFIHSSVDGHLVCFKLLITEGKTAMKKDQKNLFPWKYVFNSFEFLGLDSWELKLTLSENVKQYSKMDVPFYIPAGSI